MNSFKKITIIGALLVGVVTLAPIQAMADAKDYANKKLNKQDFKDEHNHNDKWREPNHGRDEHGKYRDENYRQTLKNAAERNRESRKDYNERVRESDKDQAERIREINKQRDENRREYRKSAAERDKEVRKIN